MKQKKSTKKFLKGAAKSAVKAKHEGKPAGKKFGKPGKDKPVGNNKKTPNDLGDARREDQIIKLKAPKGKKPVSVKGHKDELKGLEETDPEFFKFLQKNDTNLLDFGADDDESAGGDDYEEGDLDDFSDNSDDSGSDGDDSEDEEDDDEDDGSIQEGDLNAKRTKKRIELSIDIVEASAKKALSSDSLTELKKLLAMFRTACIPSGESESDLAEGGRSMGDVPLVSRYSIPTADVYEKVMLTSMTTVHEAFGKHLEIRSKDFTRAGLAGLDKRPKWKKLQLLVISYFKSIMHTIAGLAESTKQNSVALFLVDSLENYIPFLAPLPRLAKNVVKVLLDVWAQQPSLSSATEAPATDKVDQLTLRGHAFLRIRQIAVQLPGALAEECFRSMYLKFARQSKSYNELTAPSVVFMIQSVAELYGTDLALGYQQAFLYIRQLALHLRAALLKKSDETTRQITSMQYLNCLRLWTRVVSAYPSSEDGLGALAFPLAQVMFGVISAVPSIYYTPLKFNLITCLHQLAAACNLFIPTTSIVVEVLEHADLVAKPTPSTDLTPKLDHMVRLPTNSVAKAVVRDAIVTEAVQLIRQDTEVYRFHVGLPEYLYLTIRKLKAYLKKCKITKWRDIVRNVTGQMESYSTSAQQGRTALSVGPMSVVDFEPLIPSGTPSAKIRLHKLIAGGKGDLLVAAHLKPDNKAKTAKDLFASSYSSIKAEQIKAANNKRKVANPKKAAGGADSDSENDNGDDDSENEDADSMDEGDDVVYSDEEDGDSFQEQSGSEDELNSDFDSEAEEEARKPSKAAAKKATTPAKNTPGKGKKPAVKFAGKSAAIDSMQDDVGAFDWDDEEDRF